MVVEDGNIPTNQGLAMILMVTGVLLPATAYWQYGGAELLGDDSLVKLIALTGASGAVGLALYAGLRGWARALLPGALAGAGASGLQVAYVLFLDRSSVFTGELILVSFVGAVPGLLLFALTRPSAD